MVRRLVEAHGELIQLKVDAHLDVLGAWADLPGGAWKRARHIGASAQGVGASYIRLGCTVDEAAWLGLARLWKPRLWEEWLVAIFFHGVLR
jgi:hypothetical protein